MIAQNNEFDIRYFYKANGGKHTALNIGFEKCKNELLLILDSDDFLIENALEKVSDIWLCNRSDQSIAGIIGLCFDSSNDKLIGSKFEKHMSLSTITKNMFYYNRRGDTCDFIRAKYICKYRFPEIPGTRFIPESIVTYELDRKYQYLCVNEVYKSVEYQCEGMTNNFLKLTVDNADGYLLRFKHLIHDDFLKQMNYMGRLKVSANYYRYLHHSSTQVLSKRNVINRSTVSIHFLGFLLGTTYYLKDWFKLK